MTKSYFRAVSIFILSFFTAIPIVSGQHTRLWGTTYNGGALGAGCLFRYNYITDSLEVVYSFNPFGPNRPDCGIISDSVAGKLYGATSGGGLTSASQGTIYSFSPADSSFNVIYDCYISAGGISPLAVPIQTKANEIWGTDMFGGNYSYCTLYSLNLTTGQKTIRKHFSASQGTGYAPYQGPVFANGKLYGLTHGASASGGMGVLYELDTATNVYTVKKQLTPITGDQPQGRLLLHPNGRLYGATTSGGTNSRGTFFEYNPVNDSFIVRHNFNLTLTGSTSTGFLMLHPNGRIYGLASSGGTAGAGTIFEYDTATRTVSKKIDLIDSIGSYPLGGLTLAANGKMYAVTNKGGANSVGTIMEYDPATNILRKKVSFNYSNGAGPTWVVLTDAWTNDRPVLAAFDSKDTLCTGDSASRLIYAADGDGDTLQSIAYISDTAKIKAAFVRLKYIGSNLYRMDYKVSGNNGDTGNVAITVKLVDAYGAISKDSVLINVFIRNCTLPTAIYSTRLEQNELELVPNPAHRSVRIRVSKMDETLASCKVIDSYGHLIEVPLKQDGPEMVLDVSSIPAGNYYVVAQTRKGAVYVQQFIKN